jgi:hypothetical protein
VAAEVSRFSERRLPSRTKLSKKRPSPEQITAPPKWELAGWISTYAAIAAGEFDVVTNTSSS